MGFHEIDTEGSVTQTAVALFEAGIQPQILEDACARTTSARYHKAGLIIAGQLTASPESQRTGRAPRGLAQNQQDHLNPQGGSRTDPNESGIDQ